MKIKKLRSINILRVKLTSHDPRQENFIDSDNSVVLEAERVRLQTVTFTFLV